MLNPQRVLILIVLSLACAAPAFAQTKVRATRDQVSVWGQGFTTIVAVVSRGTELEVIGRQGGWYEVRLPEGYGAGQVGFVAIIQVELISGAAPPDSGPPRGARPAAPATTVAETTEPAVRGFLHVGYDRFSASKTFDAVLEKSGGVVFGGGLDFRLPMGLFVQATAERFKETGERVFVSGGEVFRLGIEDRITIVPIQASVGYRFGRGRIVPYAGGGAGIYLFKEEADLAEAGDNVDERFTSYHALGGVEFRGTGWLSTAFEAQYTRVSDALTGVVATEFDEHDLGGVQARVKVVIGR